MTFDEFCIQWDVTGHERRKLRLLLCAIRLEATLKMTRG
jgi:hypothetical protein